MRPTSARDLLLYAEKSHDKENQKAMTPEWQGTHGFGKALHTLHGVFHEPFGYLGHHVRKAGRLE